MRPITAQAPGGGKAERESGTLTGGDRASEREKARGGCGVVMMFGSAPVHPSSAGGVEYWDPAVVPHLRRMADAVHEFGALCLAQLAHWGRAGVGIYADSPLLAPPTSRTSRTTGSRAPCPAVRSASWSAPSRRRPCMSSDGPLDGIRTRG
jgi:2,4-dienoyl-CoA reductase-like NADH-dependent reductase (Old Yellow Enzyme family)